MPEGRSPGSARFRRLAETVVDGAAEHVGGGEWVIACGDGDELVTVAASRDAAARPGERLKPDPEADLVVPVQADGHTFGALFGIGARQAPPGAAVLGHLERLAGLLAGVAAAETEVTALARRAEAAAKKIREVEVEALTDPLTGLANRRGWDRALAAEERRRRRYGGPASVIVVDLDELKEINDSQGHLSGDLLLKLVGRVIREASRESDFLARTGGDEFAVLALDCDEPQLHVLVARLREALEREGAAASVGAASRRPSSGMAEAWAEADEVMFAEKTRRKG